MLAQTLAAQPSTPATEWAAQTNDVLSVADGRAVHTPDPAVPGAFPPSPLLSPVGDAMQRTPTSVAQPAPPASYFAPPRSAPSPAPSDAASTTAIAPSSPAPSRPLSPASLFAGELAPHTADSVPQGVPVPPGLAAADSDRTLSTAPAAADGGLADVGGHHPELEGTRTGRAGADGDVGHDYELHGVKARAVAVAVTGGAPDYDEDYDYEVHGVQAIACGGGGEGTEGSEGKGEKRLGEKGQSEKGAGTEEKPRRPSLIAKLREKMHGHVHV
ncbi:hypothetical protein B0H15DRAFT_89188 [Mycena belliarum]|uniref:Uncharacterized protein n=1 Tax=Mycena belliarum TaxID=1033014 RepID=A0AAD6TM24_9AGAR|nr:hypothetical protein B0H15DRAFT_89188 [Mycena belliae]